MEPWDCGLPGCLQCWQGPWSRCPICKIDHDSKVRRNSQHGFGKGLISFCSRVGGQGDEEDVTWL